MHFRGQCLLNRAELMRFHGAWQEAAAEALRASERMAEPEAGASLGEAVYQTAELHRLRGDFADAEASPQGLSLGRSARYSARMLDRWRGPSTRVAGLVGAALLLSACTASSVGPTPSPTPSTTVASVTPEPTEPSPEPTPAGSPPAFVARTVARVGTADLVVHSEPSLASAPLTGESGDTSVKPGEYVIVVGEAQAADGIWWLPVVLDQSPDSKSQVTDVAVGWIAAGTDAQPAIVVADPTCPAADVAALGGLSTLRRIACFGSETIAFDAHQASVPPDGGLGGACGGNAPRPDWLLCDNINYSWVNADGGTDWTFLLHFDPAVGIPEIDLAPVNTTGPAYHITGHFSDPAAEDCLPDGATPGSVEAEAAWVGCASKFVVETLQLLG